MFNPRSVFYKSDDSVAKIEVTRSSQGRTRSDALVKADNLLYNWHFSNDTLVSDEYYTIPPEYKWSGGLVEMDVYISKGTIVGFDKSSDIFYSPYSYNNDFSENENKWWLMTDDGLTETTRLDN